MIFIFKTNVKQHQSISPLVCLQFRVFRLLGLKKVLIAVCTRFLVHLDKNEISHVLFLLFLLICSTLNKARSQRQRLTGRLRPSVTCERFPTQSWSRSGVREGEVWRGGWSKPGVSCARLQADGELAKESPHTVLFVFASACTCVRLSLSACLSVLSCQRLVCSRQRGGRAGPCHALRNKAKQRHTASLFGDSFCLHLETGELRGANFPGCCGGLTRADLEMGELIRHG